MKKNILLRLDEKDQKELINLINNACRVLKLSATALTQVALYDYCSKFKKKKNAKTKM